jgi:hypothetical protein
MEDLAVELGSGRPFWDLEFDKWQCLATPSWITFTWRALSSSPLSLHGPAPLIKPQRINDIYLMDMFVDADLPPDQLKSLNDVRMYKQVTLLSDICSADGSFIVDSFLSSEAPKHPSSIEWPRCYRPSPHQFTLWKSTLLACFVTPHATHKRLLHPLGTWLASCDLYWEWWFSQSLNCLLKRTPDQWILHPFQRTQYQRDYFHPSVNATQVLPPDAVRATVSSHGPRVRLLNTSAPTPVIPNDTPTSLHDIIAHLPPEQKWAICYIDAPSGTLPVAQAISSFQCFAVTDASLKDGCGTAAFILVGASNDHAIRAVNLVPGPIPNGNSFRCELSGIYGILVVIHIVCTIHNITSGSVHLRCDNRSSLRVFEPWFIPDPNSDSFDLINAIWQMLRTSPLKWTAEWVRGHQDKLGPVHDRFALLNCDMDELATQYRAQVIQANPTYSPPTLHLAHEGWSIWCDEEKIHSPTSTTLYDCIYRPRILKYWTDPHRLLHEPRLSDAAISIVDWDAVDTFMKALPAGKRRWCTKNASENCGVGITLKAWKKQHDDECPLCRSPENTTHVLRCTAQDSSTIWDESLHNLSLIMLDYSTPIDLHDAVLSRLNDWRNHVPFSDPPEWHPHLRDLIHSQDLIGWKNFLEGLPSTQWTPFMASHFTSIDSHASPTKWLSAILRAVHDVAWNQWQYRNRFLHEEGVPRQLRAVSLLHQQITQEFLRGPEDLPPVDHRFFQAPLHSLLSRATTFKQSWYLNVTAARDLQAHRTAALGVDRAESVGNARLTHWIRTGRLQ